MHAIKLTDMANDKILTQAILQIAQMLGLYQAELARILGVQCGDIGAFAAARTQLCHHSPAWQKARQFVRFYERLFEYCHGDGVAMFHWLRASQPGLLTTPFLLMVDEARLDEVLAWFDAAERRSIEDNEKNIS